MACTWKKNWKQSREHFIAWWSHEGFVLNTGSCLREAGPRDDSKVPPPKRRAEDRYTDVQWRVNNNHARLSRSCFPADSLPISTTDIGPGSLALLLGSAPGFSDATVWYYPFDGPGSTPDRPGTLSFDDRNRWWVLHRRTLEEAVDLAGDRYFVGCPDLIENIDILAALRGPHQLLLDLADSPAWVEQKVAEINEVWFEAYDAVYDIIHDDEAGSVFGPFGLWGPGKTAKVQCDACAMFSPAMFDRFVLPALTEQCDWLDFSMYHLDGHQCIPHLDSLLSIGSLDAVEWTPDPQVPGGGDPEWYPMYRKILDGGKSVQAIGVKPVELEPLLDAVGAKGMYIVCEAGSEREAEKLYSVAERYL